MEQDYLYLSREFLQKVANITNWMKDNPQITKELICKELGVLFYIYSARKDNKEYQYDNTAELEMLKNTK